MAVYITKKRSWIRLLASLVPGAGIAALLCNFFAGPRLGPHYDFLLKQRSSLPVSRELLLIDTAGAAGRELSSRAPTAPRAPDETAILEPSAAASVLLTSAELGASTLILEAPVLGLSAGSSAGEDEIRYRFNEEFDILSGNIRGLFDAIRTGSVAPADAASYVAELVELSEKGKERLVASLVRRDEEGLKLLEQAEKVFGNVRRPGDLLVQVIRSGDGGPGAGLPSYEDKGEYFRAKPDSDGVIRRIAPVRKTPDGNVEGLHEELHIVYGAIRGRYEASRVEQTDGGVFLVNRFTPGESGQGEFAIPLDSSGSLLFEIPRPGPDFGRIAIGDFLDYDEAGRSLRRLLGEAETLGAYNSLPGEENPLYLWDYALSLKEELLENPGEEKKNEWIKARAGFFEKLESFLYGPSEMTLVSAYEEMIANEELGEGGEAKIAEFRDALIRCFIELRQKHGEITELRKKLMVLNGAFCILGPFSEPDLSDAEVSALLANSLLTGRAVRPGQEYLLFLAALFCVLLAALCIRPLGAAHGFLLGIALSLISGAFFAGFFIFSGYWLDPLVPAGGTAALVIFSSLWTLALKYSFSRRFRACYGSRVSRAHLRKLIRAGRPEPSEKITVRAAVVAIRDPELLVMGESTNAGPGADDFIKFRDSAAAEFVRAGGTVLGGYGDTVLGCFGSPLEKAALDLKKHGSPYEGHIHTKDAPAVRAADFVSALLRRDSGGLWHYGMDIGGCCFTWSALSGYSGFGRPVSRARILAALASRYRARFIVTGEASAALPEFTARKLAVLKNPDGSGGEVFYELKV